MADRTEERWTIHVCDRGHVEWGTLNGVCWRCYPGGRRTWEPGKPRQTEPNQTRIDVVPASRLEAAEEALRTAADDLGKAANQFASIRASQQAGHQVEIHSNPEKFAEKEARARAALSRPGSVTGQGEQT